MEVCAALAMRVLVQGGGGRVGVCHCSLKAGLEVLDAGLVGFDFHVEGAHVGVGGVVEDVD